MKTETHLRHAIRQALASVEECDRDLAILQKERDRLASLMRTKQAELIELLPKPEYEI